MPRRARFVDAESKLADAMATLEANGVTVDKEAKKKAGSRKDAEPQPPKPPPNHQVIAHGDVDGLKCSEQVGNNLGSVGGSR